jgi:CBS domain-containing protein
MKTSDVMTQEVVSVPPTATLQEAIDLMLKGGISGLPVIDKDGTLLGIVTEGDLLRRSELGTQKHRARWIEFLMSPNRLTAEYIKTNSHHVSDIMTTAVFTVEEDTALEDAVTLMETRQVKRLPVMRNGRVGGIISRSNLLRALAALKPAAHGHADDAKIRDQILREVKVHLGSIGYCDAVVKDGVVDLWGGVYSNPDAVRIAAENVPGVKEVRSHLTWYDPLSGWILENELDREAAAKNEKSSRIMALNAWPIRVPPFDNPTLAKRDGAGN